MNEKDCELMKRYIYEVVHRLPKGQRDEIAMELGELIGDMYECKHGTMEDILAELGNPKEFARKYQNFSGYLIGPEYFENYCWILKIVLLCVGISSVLSELISYSYAGFNLIEFIIEILVNTLVNISGAFGMVTIIFAILEYMQIKVDLKQEECWSIKMLEDNKQHSKEGEENKFQWNPSQLLPVPDKRALISRSDTVFGVIVIMTFGALVVFLPTLFGAYVFEGKEFIRTIPIFNMDKWNILCPIFLLIFLVCFIDEVIKLVTGCYCTLVLVSNLVTNAIQLVLSTVLIKFLPIWNPDFVNDVSKAFGREFTSKGDLLSYWGTETISNIVLAIIWIITFSEIGTTVYKTLRYGNTKNHISDVVRNVENN